MNERFIQMFTDYIFVEDEIAKADVIFVPGNGFPHMAEKAAELYRQGYAPYVIPSGRFSKVLGHFEGVQCFAEKYRGPYETEGEFLSDVLEKNGVPKEAILTEDQATFTYENAIYTRKLTDNAGIEVKKAIICCKTWHSRRCLLYYQLLYPETDFIMVGVDVGNGVDKNSWYRSEEGRNLVLGEMERCGSQFHEIMREAGSED